MTLKDIIDLLVIPEKYSREVERDLPELLNKDIGVLMYHLNEIKAHLEIDAARRLKTR